MGLPVLLNPKARSSGAGRLKEAIVGMGGGVRVYAVGSVEEMVERSRELALAGEEIVVAAGGDGTMSVVLRGLVLAREEMGQEYRTALGVLPAGTMNVLARELGMPMGDLKKTWKILRAGRRREIDLWRMNGHPFLQLAGVGLDAEIIEKTRKEWKENLGALGYVGGVARVLGKNVPEIEVRVPGREPVRGTVALVGSGQRYGGSLQLFTRAANDDGKLDVLVFRGEQVWDVMGLARAVTFGGFEAVPGVYYLQAERVEVVSGRPVPGQVEGEVVTETPVLIEHAGRFPVIVGKEGRLRLGWWQRRESPTI